MYHHTGFGKAALLCSLLLLCASGEIRAADPPKPEDLAFLGIPADKPLTEAGVMLAYQAWLQRAKFGDRAQGEGLATGEYVSHKGVVVVEVPPTKPGGKAKEQRSQRYQDQIQEGLAARRRIIEYAKAQPGEVIPTSHLTAIRDRKPIPPPPPAPAPAPVPVAAAPGPASAPAAAPAPQAADIDSGSLLVVEPLGGGEFHIVLEPADPTEPEYLGLEAIAEPEPALKPGQAKPSLRKRTLQHLEEEYGRKANIVPVIEEFVRKLAETPVVKIKHRIPSDVVLALSDFINERVTQPEGSDERLRLGNALVAFENLHRVGRSDRTLGAWNAITEVGRSRYEGRRNLTREQLAIRAADVLTTMASEPDDREQVKLWLERNMAVWHGYGQPPIAFDYSLRAFLDTVLDHVGPGALTGNHRADAFIDVMDENLRLKHDNRRNKDSDPLLQKFQRKLGEAAQAEPNQEGALESAGRRAGRRLSTAPPRRSGGGGGGAGGGKGIRCGPEFTKTGA